MCLLLWFHGQERGSNNNKQHQQVAVMVDTVSFPALVPHMQNSMHTHTPPSTTAPILLPTSPVALLTRRAMLWWCAGVPVMCGLPPSLLLAGSGFPQPPSPCPTNTYNEEPNFLFVCFLVARTTVKFPSIPSTTTSLLLVVG